MKTSPQRTALGSAAILLLAGGIALGLAPAAHAQAAPFADTPTNHWAYEAVQDLAKKGIVIGYPDGTYGGKRPMTRYEFAVAIDRALSTVSDMIKAQQPGAPPRRLTRPRSARLRRTTSTACKLSLTSSGQNSTPFSLTSKPHRTTLTPSEPMFWMPKRWRPKPRTPPTTPMASAPIASSRSVAISRRASPMSALDKARRTASPREPVPSQAVTTATMPQAATSLPLTCAAPASSSAVRSRTTPSMRCRLIRPARSVRGPAPTSR